MRKMVLMLTAGVGMNSAEFFNVPADMTDEELSDYAWESAVQFASSYGLEPEVFRDTILDEDEDEDEYGNDNYTDDIEGWFEEYSPEEHDGLVCGYDSKPKFQDL